MSFVSILKKIRRLFRTNTLYHFISTLKSINETQNKLIDHSVNNCDVLSDFMHVLEDKMDFLFRSKFAVDRARPRSSAHHTCFSTPDWRFAALTYRRPDKSNLSTDYKPLGRNTYAGEKRFRVLASAKIPHSLS